jgi:glucose-1-phosphate thymidylyltransferase
LLETNRIMLEKRKMARKPANLPKDAKIVDPVYIEDGVTIARSTVGPNVAISAGSTIEDSTIRDTIIGGKSRIAKSELRDSLIGDEVVLEGFTGDVTIGDHSELHGR